MTYIPNFNDPRVIERSIHAYGFSLAILSDTNARGWAKVAFDRYFGPQSNKLSKYLRNVLLICVDGHWSMDTGKVKTYKLNRAGADYIRDILQKKPIVPVAELTEYVPQPITPQQQQANRVYDAYAVNQWCKREFGDELNSLTFTYNDKSGRLWNPLQNVKRELKRKLLNDAGLKYHYDIESCAPTLILQYAQRHGLKKPVNSLNEYLADKHKYREHIGTIANVDNKTAKVVINSLFCGARLGNNDRFTLTEVLDFKRNRIDALKNDTFVSGLRQDIKHSWEAIIKTLPRVSVLSEKTGKWRLKPVNSRQKWAVYFQLERAVLDRVKQYLDLTENKCFLEHDGWSTEHEVDEDELIAYVKKYAGFDISLSVDNETDEERTGRECISHHTQYPIVLQVNNIVTVSTKKVALTNAERQKRYRESKKLTKTK